MVKILTYLQYFILFWFYSFEREREREKEDKEIEGEEERRRIQKQSHLFRPERVENISVSLPTQSSPLKGSFFMHFLSLFISLFEIILMYFFQFSF